jgi:hypothetical protein
MIKMETYHILERIKILHAKKHCTIALTTKHGRSGYETLGILTYRAHQRDRQPAKVNIVKCRRIAETKAKSHDRVMRHESRLNYFNECEAIDKALDPNSIIRKCKIVDI